MALTKEQIEEIAQATKTALQEMGLTDVKRPFAPGAEGGDGETKIVKDAGDQPWGEKHNAFGNFLQAIHRNAASNGRDFDPRLARSKATGLSEQVASEGGFLVSQEFVATLLERMYQTGIVASKCARQPVGAGFNGVVIPAVNETSRADGSRWGGIRAYWGAEGGTKTASSPRFRQVKMELQKLYGLCYATDELLQDAVALEGYVNRWFPLEFGFKMDDAILAGDGAGKPFGIIGHVGTVSVAKETGQQAATIVTENIVKMWSRCWAPSRGNAIWLINQDCEPQLFTLSLAVGTGGIPVYLPANGLSGTPYGTLLGRPVIPVEQCPTLGTVGDIILGDFSQYLLIDKGGIQAASSIHVQFTTDETAFRFVYRVNGQPIWNSVLTPKSGSSNTLAPFVTLATRS